MSGVQSGNFLQLLEIILLIKNFIERIVMKKNIIISTMALTYSLVFFLAAGFLASCQSPASKQINVYVWEGYVPEEAAAII